MFWNKSKRKKGAGPDSGFEIEPVQPPHADIDPSLTVEDFLDGFAEGALVDAIDNLLYRELMDGPEALSGFERYAARLFSDIDVVKLRSIMTEHLVGVTKLGSTDLFWLGFSLQEVSDDDAAALIRVESILNRLVLVSWRLAKHDQPPRLASTSERACAEADWEMVRCIAEMAPEKIKEAPSTNPLLSFYGATGRRGGNWDVITRFTEACESLALPFRFEYRLLADAATGLVAIRIELPPKEWFPTIAWEKGQWRDCSSGAGDEAAAYYVRLAMLVAGAGFGSSVGVSRIVIDAVERGETGSRLLLDLSRAAFLRHTVPAIESGQASSPDVRRGLSRMLGMLAPTRWAVLSGPSKTSVAASDDAAVEDMEGVLRGMWRPLDEDDRAIPEELADVLFADKASDLNVFEPTDEIMAARFNRIAEDAKDSPLLAIAQLEDVVAAFDAEAPDDGTAPLFCENPFNRCALSLLQPPSKKRYHQLPDFAMDARIMLFRLFMEMGDTESAMKQADRCRALAPTSSGSYLMTVDVLGRMDRVDDVIDTIERALVSCMTVEDADYYYYRLGGALWYAGRKDESLAAFALVRPNGEWGEEAASDARAFASELGRSADMPAGEAASRLRGAGMTIAPSDAAKKVTALAAIGLCDAGLYSAAAAAAHLLGRHVGSDAVLVAAHAMRRGVIDA